ncbi:type IV secretory pathway TrbD component/type IV secretory pathway VirB2 component (pilin) [Bradyrhizobium sp. LM6.11]
MTTRASLAPGFISIAAFATLSLASAPAWAAGSNMPWEQPLNQILQSVEGPVAKIIAVIIIIVTGLSLALWRHLGWFPAASPDRVWPVDRIRRIELLPVVLLIRRRSGDLMDEPVPGFVAPVHRALTEPILMGGAPRAVAILNGTLAAALGLGLRMWLAGLLFAFVGHMAAVWAAKRDPEFVEVVRRHVRIPAHLST